MLRSSPAAQSRISLVGFDGRKATVGVVDVSLFCHPTHPRFVVLPFCSTLLYWLQPCWTSITVSIFVFSFLFDTVLVSAPQPQRRQRQLQCQRPQHVCRGDIDFLCRGNLVLVVISESGLSHFVVSERIISAGIAVGESNIMQAAKIWKRFKFRVENQKDQIILLVTKLEEEGVAVHARST
jgi:hypothetical protein